MVQEDQSTSVRIQAPWMSRRGKGLSGPDTLNSHNRPASDFSSVYKATHPGDPPSEKREHHFCSKCSSMLWWFDPKYSAHWYPFASAIDEPTLSPPEEMVCIQEQEKPPWVRLPEGPKKVYEKYPPDSLKGWHKKHHHWVE